MDSADTTVASQKWTYALRVEAAIKALLDEQTFPPLEVIEDMIKEFRIACEAVLFLDLEYATSVAVGSHLWDAHILINNRYRRIMEGYKRQNGKQNTVERRKWEKRYVDFIKYSQYFYKSFIQRLASHYSGSESLRRVAHRLTLSTLSVDNPVRLTPDLEVLVTDICHTSILYLGDLHRYRNMVRSKERSWEMALSYYTLANDFCPEKGSAHNQMAVVALADTNHLDAVYHLYRALMSKEPHSLARGNLGIEFKKIVTAWKQKRQQPLPDGLTQLIWWFTLLHARFYEGVEFSGREELENEVLSRLAILLKKQPFPEDLQKVVIINIAAESFAAQKIEELGSNVTPESIAAYFFYVRFNCRMMSRLLQVLLPELEDDTDGDDLPNGNEGSKTNKDRISAAARRIFPVLRQYGSWLACASPIIANIHSGPIEVHIKEMWKLYAIVLTRIANYFSPVDKLFQVDYLLEEDEATVGFQPLRRPDLKVESSLFHSSDGSMKPRATDSGIARHHPNAEMESRIRDILISGLSLQQNDYVPIRLDSSGGEPAFRYMDEGLQIPAEAQRSQSQAETASSQHSMVESLPRQPRHTPDEGHEEVTDETDDTASMSDSMENDMSRMVDDLLEPSTNGDRSYSKTNETSYGMHSLTANEIFAPIGSNGFEPRHQSTPKVLPSLPGLYNSAFTPKPFELQPTSPTRPLTARQISPLSLATNEQQLAAAAALDAATGYTVTRDPSGSWGRRPSRPSNRTTQPVSQILQESLTQQYMPGSSFSFSDSSSIYANTPALGNGAFRNGSFAPINGHAAANDYERTTMLQSSIWNGSQSTWPSYVQTPPGNQGG